MESKTLNSIQTVSQICKVISKIIEVCCTVGCIICGVALVGYAMYPHGILKLGGMNVHLLLEKTNGLSDEAIIAYVVLTLVICIAEGIVAKAFYNYFKNELKAGTPFTFEGAKELMRVGILSMVIPMVALIGCQIAINIASELSSSNLAIDFDPNLNIGVGVVLIIMSLVCKHGAEVQRVTVTI